MSPSWTFGRRLAIGFGLAAVTMLVIIAFSYRSTSDLIAANDDLARAHLVREAIAQLRSGLKDAETGQRGYLLTGREAYLTPYTDALQTIPAALSDLGKLLADSPDQQRRIADVQVLVATKLGELAETVRLRRTRGLAAAIAVVETDAGKTTMDQIRRILEDVDRTQLDLLAVRRDSAEAAARQSIAIILWGGLASMLVVAMVGWLTTRGLARRIGAVVEHVQASSAELHAAAAQQASGVTEQVSSMTEIGATIRELLATSQQIAESARRVAAISGEASSAANAGDGTVRLATETMTGVHRQVEEVGRHMLDLGLKSQQIGAVLDIVTELAEQTNILSINAAIEAAGAGEQGRRFATVAEEIRKLADRVGGSAKQIREMIDDIRGSVRTTVAATESGSRAVESGTRRFDEVTTGFRRIAELVVATLEAAREIELSTNQQASAVAQVNMAIDNVVQATRETEASASQTIQTAAELASTSRVLLRLVQARPD